MVNNDRRLGFLHHCQDLNSAEWSSSQIDIYGIKLVINGTDRNGTERNKKFRLLNLQCLQLSRVQTPTPGLGSRLGLGGRLDLTKLPTGK